MFRAERPSKGSDRSQVERLGLVDLLLPLEDRGERGDVGRHRRVLGTERSFADREPLPRMRLRPREAAPRVFEPTEVVQNRCDVGVAWPLRLSRDGESASVQAPRLGKARRVFVNDGEAVHR